MFEDFTEKAIKVIMLAQEESRRLGHNFVGTEQILLGLIGEGTGVAAKVLKSMGVNLKDARIEVEKIIGRGSGFVTTENPFTPRAKRVLELSLEESRNLGHNYVGTEHLLLGLVHEGEGVAARVLETLGVNLSSLRTQVIRVLVESNEANEVQSTSDDKEASSNDEFEITIKPYVQQLEDVRAINNKTLENDVLRMLGELCLKAGQYQQAASYFEQQISVTQELNDLNGETQATGNLGIVLKQLQQYDDAIECFEKFLDLSEHLTWKVFACNELAIIYSLLVTTQP
jgi:ATP-dependent Clp protease ATP-binding subunit ClpA